MPRADEWHILNEGVSHPLWSRQGHQLFFRSANNYVMAAGYNVKGDSFVAEKPQRFLQKELVNPGLIGRGSYDVAPDGHRVLALTPVETLNSRENENHVVFRFNFLDEPRRRVPALK
jgi:hypothetical protein